jgi:SAM-dependent methyltransferase
MAANRSHWNEVVPIHARSAFYDLDGFKRGATALTDIELSEIGDVAGRALLHLQCHFGMGSLSWARLGAQVTGVDFSEQAIALARSLGEELGIPAQFVCSNVYDLPRVLDRKFDVVFTSYGVLCWLPDLPAWGALIARYLEPGGTFYIVESHPFSHVFSSRRDAHGLEIEMPYFGDGPALASDGDGTYADWEAKLARRVTYEWQHSLADIVEALLGSGLRIEFLHEHPVGVWQQFPCMRQDEDGWWRLPEDLRDKVPLTFSLKATAA